MLAVNSNCIASRDSSGSKWKNRNMRVGGGLGLNEVLPRLEA